MKTISPDRETQIVNSYNKRKLGQLKKRRELRKTKIFVARVRFAARILSIALLAWLFTIIVHLPQWYLNKNIFKFYPNDYVEIEGNKIVSARQIFSKLKVFNMPDKPVYLINTKPIETKILELTPVKKVFIRRYWFPARLRIVLDERTPVLSIAPTPKIDPVAVFTDDDGVIKILDKEFLPLPSSKETYKVITYDQFSLWKPSLVQYISKFAFYIENATNQKLEYIDIRNPDDVFIQLKEVKLRIGRINGSTTFSNVDKVLSVLPEALKIKNEIEYIDLRWDNVSIKLKDKKQEAPKEKAAE
jgi:cell division septal protein FtsQ